MRPRVHRSSYANDLRKVVSLAHWMREQTCTQPSGPARHGPLRETEAVMKRILVALDGSPRAPQVLEAAVRLAELAGGKLVLYRAITVSPDLPRAVLVETNRRLEDILVANAREDLAHSAAHLRPEFVEKTVTAFAIPWDGICRAARECDADLIVIGSHGDRK